MKRKYPIKKKKFAGQQREKKSLRKMAFSHPNCQIQRKCFAVLLLMFLFNATFVGRILGLSAATIRNYWRAYKLGGIEALERWGYKGSSSSLEAHSHSIDKFLEKDPPHTISEAISKIERFTGIKRSAKSIRSFLKRLKFRYRKVGTIPAKADIAKQAEFLISSLYPCLLEAIKKTREVLFLDAAHFVHGAFLGSLWSKERIFVKTPSGRKRLNVLGAVNAITQQLHIFSNETYINSQVLCHFLQELAKVYVGKPITIVLDNARYQRCTLVQNLAESLGIQLLFLPSYSPNLNIIERIWKFIKKKALNSRYYETFPEFRTALLQAVENCNDEWCHELKSLLTLNFQTFNTTHLLPTLPAFDEHFSEENLLYA